MADNTTNRTIADFGIQWTSYTKNKGYYASQALFEDICGPVFDLGELAGARVLDVGSGTGRVVRMLLEVGAREVVAVEPSDAFAVLRANTEDVSSRIEYQKARGDTFQASNVDVAVSFGVLHHIPDPDPTVARIYRALKPGGTIVVWLYGREGNEVYLAVVQPLRAVTKRLPKSALSAVSYILTVALAPYIAVCRVLPLPMRSYMRNHLGKLGWHERFLTVFDQLNPAYAKYYRKAEAVDLLQRAGFVDVTPHHRHAYSWTVVGRKPAVDHGATTD